MIWVVFLEWRFYTGFTVNLGAPILNGKVDTIKSGWSIVYIEGLHVIISIKYYISLKIDFALANSADLDAMPPYAVFHLDLYCLP